MRDRIPMSGEEVGSYGYVAAPIERDAAVELLLDAYLASADARRVVWRIATWGAPIGPDGRRTLDDVLGGFSELAERFAHAWAVLEEPGLVADQAAARGALESAAEMRFEPDEDDSSAGGMMGREA